MTQERVGHSKRQDQSVSSVAKGTYYDLLGVSPTANAQEIRQAYRELSKLYHPDTTQLTLVESKHKFQVLNEAYATLSNPDKRLKYDQKAGFSKHTAAQPLTRPQTPKAPPRPPVYSSSAYLDPNDRPLSPGEIFALVILGFTFLICLVLAVVLSFAHGEFKLDILHSSSIARSAATIVEPAAVQIPSGVASSHPESSEPETQTAQEKTLNPLLWLPLSIPGFNPQSVVDAVPDVSPAPAPDESGQVSAEPASIHASAESEQLQSRPKDSEPASPVTKDTLQSEIQSPSGDAEVEPAVKFPVESDVTLSLDQQTLDASLLK